VLSTRQHLFGLVKDSRTPDIWLALLVLVVYVMFSLLVLIKLTEVKIVSGSSIINQTKEVLSSRVLDLVNNSRTTDIQIS
jgi:hypothetical protein